MIELLLVCIFNGPVFNMPPASGDGIPVNCTIWKFREALERTVENETKIIDMCRDITEKVVHIGGTVVLCREYDEFVDGPYTRIEETE